MTASVALTHTFSPPLSGFLGGDNKPMQVMRAEVEFDAFVGSPGAVLRGFSVKEDGNVGASRRVAALDEEKAWSALPAPVQRLFLERADEEARRLVAYLQQEIQK